ncbi:MAG: type IV pilus biogenesis protein PilM [Solirubrobacterales bacterium]
MQFFKRPRLYLDMHDSYIRALQSGGTRTTIEGFGHFTMPVVLDRWAGEEEARNSGLALQEFLNRTGLNAVEVSIVLSRDGIITRTTRVPAMEESLLTGFMSSEISEFLPVDLAEYRYDYRVMRSYLADDDGKEYFDLLIGAVPNTMIQQVMQLIEMTGMEIRTIDILPNALLRLFSRATKNDIAVLDAGQDGTRMSIFTGSSLLLYTDIPWRLAAEAPEFALLLEETRGYLNFFASRNQGRQPDALIVIGELARIPEGVQYLKSSLELPVEARLDHLIPLSLHGNAYADFEPFIAEFAANIGLMFRKD